MSVPYAQSAPRRALSRLVEPVVLFPLVAVVLLAVVWGSTLALIGVERTTARRVAATTALDLADTYEAQLVRALREIDQTLKLVRFAHERGAGRVDLAALKSRGLLPPDLLFLVSVVDAEGHVIAASRSGPDPGGAIPALLDRLSGADAVAVSRATVDAQDPEPMLHFARRLQDGGGKIAGAAVVTVPASYFVAGYETQKLGAEGLLGLLGVDGVFRVRRTGESLRTGEAAEYARIMRAAPALEAAVSANPWDDVRRYTVAREIFDFPLALVVGLSESEQLAPVERRAQTYLWRAGAASALLLAILAALGGLSFRLARTRLEANRALQEEIAVRRGAEAALNLRNRAIESSVNAILISDAARPGHPIEYVNPAFERMTGYTAAEALGRGAEFLLGEDVQQSARLEIERARREKREGHAVLRTYRKDGTLFWSEFYTAPVRNGAGEVTHFVGVMNDVTEAKQYEQQLEHQANFDVLTGLANRNLLQDRLQQAIAGARREGRAVATVFLDLDHFKVVNDSLGHRVGDELLQLIAERLRASVRESDTVARLGGDEFVLVIEAGADAGRKSLESDLSAVMNKVLHNVAAPVALGGAKLLPTCSIGVSIYPQDGESADVLLRNADAAMYRAKELGRNRFQLYTADVHERIHRRMELESSLRLAVERGEFVLHYQPQVALADGRIVGAEALVRWRHPERGLVSPAQFIGFAEETGLIVPIGEWVLRTACAQAKAWQEAGLPRIPVAVNISARQCEREDFVDTVRDALEWAGLEPRYLELEITEGISMARPEQSVPLMRRLATLGVSLSIDDFGTGFSNLGYLPRFPIDRLKIDMGFVRQMVIDPGSLAISEAIITMSHRLAMKVVAEGVENLRQLELLGERGCDTIQGYLFSPPVEPEAFARLLSDDRRLDYRQPAAARHAPSLVS